MKNFHAITSGWYRFVKTMFRTGKRNFVNETIQIDIYLTRFSAEVRERNPSFVVHCSYNIFKLKNSFNYCCYTTIIYSFTVYEHDDKNYMYFF